MLYPLSFDGEHLSFPLALVRGFEPLIQDHAFVVTGSIDPAISIYPVIEWDYICSELERLPTTNTQVRRLQRVLIGHAVHATLDSDQRLEIPRTLKRHAGIRKRAVALAFPNKLELLNPDTLQRFMRAFEPSERRELIGVLRDTFDQDGSTAMDALYPSAAVVRSFE